MNLYNVLLVAEMLAVGLGAAADICCIITCILAVSSCLQSDQEGALF
jgi:hypothetical protein